MRTSSGKLKAAAELVAACVICLSVGWFGSTFSSADTFAGWYDRLEKPFFNPPGWVFAPVWTALYILMGIAAFLVWRRGIEKRTVKIAILFFVIQLILNGAWSWIFFGLNQILPAFIELLFLWTAIVVTMSLFYKLSRPAFYLLLPYLFWTSFAAVLNLSLWRLNT